MPTYVAEYEHQGRGQAVEFVAPGMAEARELLRQRGINAPTRIAVSTQATVQQPFGVATATERTRPPEFPGVSSPPSPPAVPALPAPAPNYAPGPTLCPQCGECSWKSYRPGYTPSRVNVSSVLWWPVRVIALALGLMLIAGLLMRVTQMPAVAFGAAGFVLFWVIAGFFVTTPRHRCRYCSYSYRSRAVPTWSLPVRRA
jgi:hypothetical protein